MVDCHVISFYGSPFIWVSYGKPCSSYCVMLYFWWDSRGNLKTVAATSGLLHGCASWKLFFMASVHGVCNSRPYEDEQAHFPSVLNADFTKPETFRDLTKPIGALTEPRLAQLKVSDLSLPRKKLGPNFPSWRIPETSHMLLANLGFGNAWEILKMPRFCKGFVAWNL